MDAFIQNIKPNFIDCGYELTKDWPRCWFKLTSYQTAVYKRLEAQKEIQKLIFQCEFAANEKYRLNAGIMGATHIGFDRSTSTLVIDGSFAVTELFINYFLSITR